MHFLYTKLIDENGDFLTNAIGDILRLQNDELKAQINQLKKEKQELLDQSKRKNNKDLGTPTG